MKETVYRSGVIRPPSRRGVEARSFFLADQVRPIGHQSRSNAIFASPTLQGVVRWAHGNLTRNRCADPFVRAITVDPDKVFVYSVTAWDKASRGLDDNYEEYWTTGISLTEWLETSELRNSSDWEVLLAASDVQSFELVNDNRLLEASESFFNLHAELASSLTSARKALRWA